MWIVVVEGAEPGVLDALVRRHRRRGVVMSRAPMAIAILVRARDMPDVPHAAGITSFVGRVSEDYEVAGDGAVAQWCEKATPKACRRMIG